MGFFKRKFFSQQSKKADMPDGLWIKCESCNELIYKKKLEENNRVCSKCNHHFNITAQERVNLLMDEGTFTEHDADMVSVNPLNFKGPKTYTEKIEQDKKKTGLKSAVLTGVGDIEGIKTAIAVTDFRFIMGSMGSVVGEKITRIIEHATANDLPVIIVSGSGGGARMYEGCISLMQMAKTSAALARLSDKGLPFISILTNPTMAGIMASFASLGDLIVAEPKALIGFTGPRVIQQTIKQKLPAGFQRSEFLLEHGFLDKILDRNSMKKDLAQLLSYTYNKK